MPVIINDFEVVAEAPRTESGAASAPGTAAGPSASQASGASAPSPLDILRVLEHQFLRQMRLWAH